MSNQRGEIVTGVMVVMMVGMMIFSRVFMHGDHGEHAKNDQQTHSETGQHHMHHGDTKMAQQYVADEGK